MGILSREQKRRENLPIRKKEYVAEIRFLIRYIRSMAKEITKLRKEVGYESGNGKEKNEDLQKKNNKPGKKKTLQKKTSGSNR